MVMVTMAAAGKSRPYWRAWPMMFGVSTQHTAASSPAAREWQLCPIQNTPTSITATNNMLYSRSARMLWSTVKAATPLIRCTRAGHLTSKAATSCHTALAPPSLAPVTI